MRIGFNTEPLAFAVDGKDTWRKEFLSAMR